MPLCPVGHGPTKPAKAVGRTGQGSSTASSPPCGITLWRMKSPLWKGGQSSNSAAFPIQVVRGLLGRPHLLLGEYRGPAISFSEGGGKVWAALCGDESDIGIDVAGTDEFQREYPFQRVFQPQELQHALTVVGRRVGKGLGPALVYQGSRGQGLGMCLSSRGSAANHRLSVDRGGGRGGRRVYLSGGLITEGCGAVSYRCRLVPMGTFASPGEDVAFHRPFESVPSMRRWRRRFNARPYRGKMSIHDERS